MLDLLFVMDPVERLDAGCDSSLALVRAAREGGHRVDCVTPPALELDGPNVLAGGRRVDAYDAAFLRTDPPFDLEYLTTTLLLDRVGDRCLMVNDPRGVRSANEKLYALRFPEFVPATRVTSSIATLRRFLIEMGGEMIVKPLDRCGGSGVLHVRADDRNTPSLLEIAICDGRLPVVAQRYLPEARQGDKRILLLDGAPLGAILRVPAEHETRANLHVGGRAEPTVLTARERAMCAAVGERCRRDGLHFVGIDVIGGHLTEVNVTSPTGLLELAALYGGDPAGDVIEWVRRRVPATRVGLAA